MKKIFYICACLSIFLLTGCKDDEVAGENVMQFTRSLYVMSPFSSVDVILRAGAPVKAPIEVEFDIQGNAVLDDEYTLSATKFVFKEGEQEACITLSPKDNMSTSKEVRIAPRPVSGYSFGGKKVALVVIEPKETLVYSFVLSKADMLQEVDVEVKIFGSDPKKTYASPIELHLPLKIESTSTAILGTNFKIKGDATEIVIPRGKNKGKVTLEIMAFDPVAKPFIDLSLDVDKELYIAGDNSNMKIYLRTLAFEDLVGEWEYSSFMSKGMEMWGWIEMVSDEAGDDLSLMPENNTKADKLIFKQEDGKKLIVPTMTGNLGWFFRDAEVLSSKVGEVDNGWDPKYPVTIFELSKVNRSFSPVLLDENIGKANVCFNLSDDGNTLDITMIDYDPKYFLQTSFMVMEFDPGLFYLRYEFKRVITPPAPVE